MIRARPRRLAAAAVLVPLLLTLGSCGGDAPPARPPEGSPYARAEAVVLACGVGPGQPERGWLIRRSGETADGSIARGDEASFEVAYSQTLPPETVAPVFEAAWEARFLDVPTGEAGDFG